MTRIFAMNIPCILPVKIKPFFKTNKNCVWELSRRTFLRSKSLNCLRIVQKDSAIVMIVKNLFTLAGSICKQECLPTSLELKIHYSFIVVHPLSNNLFSCKRF